MSSVLASSREKPVESKCSLSISDEVPVINNGVEESNASNADSSAGKTAWLVGDIVWSKIPGHPWWPSMIAYEPNTAMYFKYSGRIRYYHVQFFGHVPMRGWSTEKSIVLYQGKDHFHSLRLTCHGKAHRIGAKQLPLWETALKMADKAVPLNRHERQLCFTFKYNIYEKQKRSSEEGQVNEILNDFVKPKTSISSVTPKTDRKRKVKKSVGITEVTCKDKFLVVKDSVSEPVLKKATTDKNKTDVKKDLVLNAKQLVKNNRLQDNLAKTGRNKTSKKSHDGKQGDDSKSKQGQGKSDEKDKSELQDQDGDSPALKMKMKRVNAISPATGKRKRGQPQKSTKFVIINGVPPACELNADVKKQKTSQGAKVNDAKKTLNNDVGKLTLENEKQDNASDSNSVVSTDLETRSEANKCAPKLRDSVCIVCEQPESLVFCEGVCNNAFHLDCLGLSCAVQDKFLCDECTSGNHTCFICKKTNNVVQCSAANCGKFYHLDCIKTANIKVEGEKFMCPLHHCNVCGPGRRVGDNKRRLTSCMRCPTAYHSGICIVAGCLPITSNHLVCKRHFLADKRKAHHSHVNVNWCFVCSIGGTLICCESCPAAFHEECIDVSGIPEGHFFCRDCEKGKELLYGEIVWVKFGMYRWWPAEICNPNKIPINIQNLHHQPGEFPVQFLGSHDYYWIHRGRVFSYQEGDKGSCSPGGKYLGSIFKKALEEAKEKYAEWQKVQEEKAEKDMEKLCKKPPAYKHIKVNRYTTATRYVVEESESTCECSVNDENPCGPDSHCLNRILFVECSPLRCPAKEKCQNQCFVKRQYLPCEPFKTKKCGWGLKAKEDGKKGQFIIEYVGELINEATCRERVTKGSDEGVDNYYMLTIDKDCIIDAGPMANLSRFMNHSCNPNCETQKWTVNGEMRVGLFAKRDIKDKEELLFDYQLDCCGNEKRKCGCGSKNCSGYLGVRPKTQHAQLQEDKKKNTDLKKKKKKAKKIQVKNGSSPRNRRCSLPGQQPNADLHLDITPEAFPASRLDFETDGNSLVIAKVLTRPRLMNADQNLNEFKPKPERCKLNQDNSIITLNQPYATQNTSRDLNQMLLNTFSTLPSPASILSGRSNFSPPNLPATGYPNLPATGHPNLPATGYPNLPATGHPNLPATGYPSTALDTFPSFLLNTPPKPCVQVLTSPDGNQYTRTDVAIPISGCTSTSNSTVSQFAPKQLPVVTRAFHNISRGFLANRLSTAPSPLYPRFNQPAVVSNNMERFQARANNNSAAIQDGSSFPFIDRVWSLTGNQYTAATSTVTTVVDESKPDSFPCD